MHIGIPREILNRETRVAATPETVKQLIQLGFTVAVEEDAGKLAGFDNEIYAQAGAKITKDNIDIWQSDIVLKVNTPKENEIALSRTGTVLIGFIWPTQNPKLMEKMAAHGLTVISMDSVPRISRAQPCDALSSMANIAGYRAVIEAAHEFDKFFIGQITAAGKIPPAKVMVIGAGVAGLAAIGTANRLGAVVRAFDIRQELKEQIQSMGAKFIELDLKEETSNNNYTGIISKSLIQAEKELLATHVQEVDIIITTVLIPGQAAPKLITREMIDSMKIGGVVVDLASNNGGNCECTIANNIVNMNNNVKIIGYTDLPCRLPTQASQLYSANVLNMIKLLCKDKDGTITVNFDDIIMRSVTIIYEGQITKSTSHQIEEKFNYKPVKTTTAIATVTPLSNKVKQFTFSWSYYSLITLVIILFSWLVNFVPKEFLNQFNIFTLSCVIGYYVIWNVSHALHTPLMSITNAISGITIIGAILQIDHGGWVGVLSFVTIFITSINIFGGFNITQRILKMFHKN